MENLGLAVLESRWWDKGNDSVKGMFDALSSIFCDNSGAYHYEMFASSDSIKEIIGRISRRGGPRLLYIASHGNEQNLDGPGENRINRAPIRNVLAVNRFDAVYFGSCEFMNVNNARFFYLEAEYISPWWFAGFSKTVPWLTSSVFDIMFFDIYFNLLSKKSNISEIDLIKNVADKVKEKLKPLCDELGFDIYVMKGVPGPRGEANGERRRLNGLISGNSWQNY